MSRTFEVLISASAEGDLEDIYRYIAESDGVGRAAVVLERLEDVISTLATLPHRGHAPKELLAVGIREYREVHFKPYRIIYRISERRVLVYGVIDGRRDMQTLLHRRLLR